MNQTAIQAELVDERPQTMALAVAESHMPPPALFGTSDPCEIVAKATAVANTLKGVIKAQGLISNISGKEYPRCEAWTLLGTMLGVFPVLVWTRKLDDGWEARVEAKTRDGAVVGAAEAQCCRSERNWSNREDFALRSMAQTRATAKALRMPLGFVMTLSGLEATPAEEMGFEAAQQTRSQKPASKSLQGAKAAQGGPSIAKEATTKTRDWFVGELRTAGLEQDALQYLIESGVIMPNETLQETPLHHVPTSKGAFERLVKAIMAFKATGKSEKLLPSEAFNVKEKPATSPELEQSPLTPQPHPDDDGRDPNAVSEPWYGFIIPVPRAGQKRDAYLKQPDTIGGLYEKRHGNDEEAAAARQRLFGFVAHYEPKGWVKRDGTQMPPSESDKRFREMLDLFVEWFEKYHPGEKI